MFFIVLSKVEIYSIVYVFYVLFPFNILRYIIIFIHFLLTVIFKNKILLEKKFVTFG